jgi:hypothetical protein
MRDSKQGHVKRTEEKYAERFKAARKEAIARDPQKIQSKRLEAIRKYEYDTRRKQWRRRFQHMKAMCIIIMLSYGVSQLLRAEKVISEPDLCWRELSQPKTSSGWPRRAHLASRQFRTGSPHGQGAWSRDA